MRNGWTGGQFSIWRAGIAVTTLVYLLSRYVTGASGLNASITWPSGVAIVLASLCLALGWFSRPAAGLLIPLTVLAPAPSPWVNLPLTLTLALFLTVRPGPFGSLKARGRQDPGGGWQLDPLVSTGAAVIWLGLFAIFTLQLPDSSNQAQTIAAMPLSQRVGCLLIGLALPFLFRSKTRPWAWLGIFVTQLILLGLGFTPELLAGVWLLLLAADPQWLSNTEPQQRDKVFYDGDCGLCHRSCRFLLAEDLQNRLFQFAPIGGPTFEEDVPEEIRQSVPDSILVRKTDGVLLAEFGAVKHLLHRLGGFWRILAWLAHLIPNPIGDQLYRVVARNRRKFFAAPSEACPVLPPHLRQQFLP